MKVKFDESKNILRVHKDISLEQTDAESVGLFLVKREKIRRLFVNKILQLIKYKEYFSLKYLIP